MSSNPKSVSTMSWRVGAILLHEDDVEASVTMALRRIALWPIIGRPREEKAVNKESVHLLLSGTIAP